MTALDTDTPEPTAPDAPAVQPRHPAARLLHLAQGFRDARWRTLLLLGGGLSLLYAGQLQIFYDPQNMPTSGGWVLILAGLAMCFVTFRGIALQSEALDVAALPIDEAAGPVRVRLPWLLTSIGLGLFAGWRATLRPPEAYFGEYLLIWCLSMLTLVAAVTPPQAEARRSDARPIRRRELALILGILLVAFLFRGTNLEHNPYLLDQDEAAFAREGSAHRANHFLVSPFESGIYGYRLLYQLLVGVSTGILGQTLTGARLVSVILGTLGVVALYLLGRELFGWRGGLVAALFMLAWPYHVHFSRLALNQIGDSLFATLAFYFLPRGLRRRAPTDYVLSGIMLGIAQLFYNGGQLAALVMVAYLVYLFLRQRELLVSQWRSLLLLVLAGLVVTLPQHIYMLHAGQPFMVRTEATIIGSGQLQAYIDDNQLGSYLLHQLSRSFLALFQYSDMGGWYGRSSNLLAPPGGPMLLIGVFASLLLLWRKPWWSLALGWSLAVILGGVVFTISPPMYQRYFPGVSAFALLVAIGVIATAFAVAKAFERPAWHGPIMLGLGGMLFFANAWFYFGVFVPEAKYFDSHVTWATNATAREMLAASDAGRQVMLIDYFAQGVENTVVVQYLLFDREYFIYDGQNLSMIDGARPFTFVIAPERTAELELIQQAFPGGALREVYLKQDGSLVFYVYEKLRAD